MKHPFGVVLVILAVWLTAQSIGLIVVEHYGAADLPAGVERPDVDASGTFWYLLVGIAIGTALIMLLARFNQQRLWIVWFSLAVFILSYVALSAFVPFVAALVIAAFFVWFKTDVRLHWIVRNVPEIFLYAGIAGVFVPMLTVPVALVLLIAISIYDAVAVWRSKHMITLARFQIESGRFAGFSMPRNALNGPTKRVSGKRTAKHAAHRSGTAILGGGDFAFPLFFSGTILLAFGWHLAIASMVGGYFGLLALFALSKENRFYPAMPFIATGLILGALFGMVL